MRKAKRQPVRAKISRNPERTQQRIIEAALKEFARHGFAGARVDVIARAARINKRMLYHYFGDKEKLFREVLRRKIAERRAWAAQAPANVLEALPVLSDLMASDPDWIRLLQFEALQFGESKAVIDEQRRREIFREAVRTIEAQQKEGLVPKDLDAGQLLVSVLALTAYPYAFPHLARLTTGLRVSSAEFQQQRKDFLARLAAHLRQALSR